MKAILLKTIGIHTSSVQLPYGSWREPLKVSLNYHLIINCKFLQYNVYLQQTCSHHCKFCLVKYNASSSLGMTPKDRKMRYMNFPQVCTLKTMNGTSLKHARSDEPHEEVPNFQ